MGIFRLIGEAILAAVVWLWDVLHGLLIWGFDRLNDLWEWVKGVVTQLWSELWAWFNVRLEQAGVLEALGAEGGEGMSGDGRSWSYWIEFLVELQWILPIGTMLGILGAAWSAVIVIRTLRWIKSFVPTISGA
jgi:hypothetical protein